MALETSDEESTTCPLMAGELGAGALLADHLLNLRNRLVQPETKTFAIGFIDKFAVAGLVKNFKGLLRGEGDKSIECLLPHLLFGRPQSFAEEWDDSFLATLPGRFDDESPNLRIRLGAEKLDQCWKDVSLPLDESEKR